MRLMWKCVVSKWYKCKSGMSVVGYLNAWLEKNSWSHDDPR